MPKQLRTAKIMISNTILMLAFVILLVASNLFFMNKINHDLMVVDEHESQKLYLILQLEDIIRERSLSMMAIYMSSDPWFKDGEYIRFQNMASKFVILRNKLEQIGLSTHEQFEFTQMLAMIKKTEPLQNDIVDRIISDKTVKIRKTISDVDVPLESKLLYSVDKLTEEIRLHGQQARMQARETSLTTLYIDIIASGFVLIGLFLLMRNSLYSLRDIETDLISQTESLNWDATHDHLTQTLNRRGLEQKLEGIRELAKHDSLHSLIFIDLDNFKIINDQYGHNVGDLLLCQIAESFQDCIRKHDSIARIGGDEFALILEDSEIRTANRIGQCLLKKAEEFTLKQGSELISIAGCSIGIYVFTPEEAELESLLKHADHACYESKRQGKNRITHLSRDDF